VERNLFQYEEEQEVLLCRKVGRGLCFLAVYRYDTRHVGFPRFLKNSKISLYPR
jgi:hypothetical protein